MVKVKAFDDDIVVPDDDALPSLAFDQWLGRAVAVSAEINTVIIVEVDQVKAHGLAHNTFLNRDRITWRAADPGIKRPIHPDSASHE